MELCIRLAVPEAQAKPISHKKTCYISQVLMKSQGKDPAHGKVDNFYIPIVLIAVAEGWIAAVLV